MADDGPRHGTHRGAEQGAGRPAPGSGQQGGDAGLRGRDLVGLGSLLVGAVVSGLVIGLLADKLAGTAPVFTLTGIFVGIALSVVGFWLRVRDALRP